MRDVFDLIDKDGSGEIDFGEMQSLMRLVGMDSSEETVKVIMSEVDADGSGEVDFGEFCQTILEAAMSKYTVYEVQSAFEDLKSGLSQHDGSSRIHRDTIFGVAELRAQAFKEGGGSSLRRPQPGGERRY